MAEDWRVTIGTRADDDGVVARALESLHERKLERDARDRLGGRVAVSRDDEHIYLYADSEAAAREAAGIVSELLGAHDLALAGVTIDRWHPVEERWENASVPLPASAAEELTEEQRREADEDADAEAAGQALWEVRIELASHEDATAFADRLEQEGLAVTRRWTYLLAGCEDEDEARALAERLEREAPAGARVAVEPGTGPIWEFTGNNPFAFFGGLAG
jgi:hypothetical protein